MENKKTNVIENKSKTYYSYQTKLAVNNFRYFYPTAHIELAYATAEIKEAAANAHAKSGEMKKQIADAIILAAREVRSGKFDDQFPLPGLQGGAGTSLHMNVNEVIATRATEILNKKNETISVHPNDHVNKSQSTNDVGPSAIKIASIRLTKELMQALELASDIFGEKAKEYANVAKVGRTHLQDAVPTTLGEEFTSYAETIIRGRKKMAALLPFFYELNLGGTAIGNSINTSPAYRKAVYKVLQKITKLPLKPAPSLMSQTSSQTDFLSLSQTITSVMADLSKIASDLRLLASGPNGGLGEISLKELQPGSSIMPGKVNPILPETMNQTYFFISGNNVTIEHAAHAAQLELGVMLPVIADRLLSSLKLASDVTQLFATNCVAHITANPTRCKQLLESSSAYATMLTPKLGYEEVSKMVKEARKNGIHFQDSITK